MSSTLQTVNTTTIVKTVASGFVHAKQIPLDPTLLKLDERLLEFFRSTVSEDDEEIRTRILDAQKK